MSTDRRVFRVALALIVVAAALVGSLPRPDAVRGLDDTPPAPVAAFEASAATASDHILLLLDELIDPSSIPDPIDFVVTVDGVDQTTTDVDLGYQGLVGSPILEDNADRGAAVLVLRWEPPPADPGPSEPPPQASEPQVTEPPQASEAPTPTPAAPPLEEPPVIQVRYTSGLHPLRDVARNETADFGQLEAEFVSEQVVIPFVDEGAGPDHLLLVVLGPIDESSLPAPEDFSVQIGSQGSFTPTSITRQHPDLGYAILDLALPTSVLYGEDVFVTYPAPSGSPPAEPSGEPDPSGAPPPTPDPQLRYASGDPVELAAVQAYVSVAETPSRATHASDPPFTPVSVSPADSTTGATLVDLEFENVTSPGTTTLTTSETSDGAAIPGALALGDPPMYFDLSTTAGFTGSVEVCIHYGLVDFPDPPGESSLRLVHEEAGVWVDRTSSIDTDADVICGLVTSFSQFAVAQAVSTYAFGGFLSPVDNQPTVNGASAGSAIPVRFSLGGDFGLAILAAGYPKVRSINCATGGVLDLIEETVSAPASSLRYTASTATYTYTWKTAKSWAGKCSELVLVFNDTSRVAATFKFR